MDDLKLVRELGGDAPLPTATDLAPARNRLMAAMAEASGTAEDAPRPGTRRRRRFLLLGGSGAGLVAAAAAVAAVVTLAPVDVVVGGEPPAASAAEVLNHAAAAARSTPFVEPRPDQFVLFHQPGTARAMWLSVDGTRDGAIDQPEGLVPVPGCRDGVARVVRGTEFVPGLTEPCSPRPAFLADLPTDVDAMLAHLDANATGAPGNVNARGKDVAHLVSRRLLKPESKGALFEAAARVPGLEVVRNREDSTGRPAVGITWPVPQGSLPSVEPVVLLFDPTTYEYLGTPAEPADEMSIVDEVGQRP